MAVLIQTVEEGSPAQAAGLLPGMRILAINGHDILDGLDYEFYATAARLTVRVEENARTREIEIKKEEYQPLGCGFETYLASAQRHCKNKCTFCFIDQLPKGMRPSLYFKDDDERLGFLFGNYITLTNLQERDVQRIIEMRFSPVNISVHTANPALRVQMMGNPHAGEVLSIIPRLAGAGIGMNFQLVLVPGVNDGEELEYSLRWLAQFGEAVHSIAAVPVGLTRHRDGLCPLQPYTRESAAAQLDMMLAAGDAFAKAEGRRLVYPADEWFLLAGREIPPAEFYDGYPQLENGVGMWRLLHDEFTEALRELTEEGNAAADLAPPSADIVVGVAAGPLFKELAQKLKAAVPGAKLYVHVVYNHFFGPGVTVTGLLTGGDIMTQLRGKVHSGRLILPKDTLRAEGDILLDGTSPEDIAKALGVQVQVGAPDGAGLVRQILCGEGVL